MVETNVGRFSLFLWEPVGSSSYIMLWEPDWFSTFLGRAGETQPGYQDFYFFQIHPVLK
jgi:hypothetical protein